MKSLKMGMLRLFQAVMTLTGAAMLWAMCSAVQAQANAQSVTSTRVSQFDWQCQDAQSNRISDHQRFDSAFVACLNATNGAYVQGGRYRLSKPVTPQPEPTTGSAQLSWAPPTKNTDGTTLTDLAGYRILYGTGQLTQLIAISNPAATSYIVTNLAPGTWYFAVSAVNAEGKESANSSVVSKTIP